MVHHCAHHVSAFLSAISGQPEGSCKADTPFFWGGVRILAFVTWVGFVTIGAIRAMASD